ncbi:MAG TPA: hypothetical protein VIT21_05080 [Chthoniobacterales bacterium]
MHRFVIKLIFAPAAFIQVANVAPEIPAPYEPDAIRLKREVPRLSQVQSFGLIPGSTERIGLRLGDREIIPGIEGPCRAYYLERFFVRTNNSPAMHPIVIA